MSGLYKLGDYEIDAMRRQIRLNGEVVPIQQKPFEVLLVLIRRAGEVVSKEELMKEIWQEAFVEEANLTQSIFLLRKAFADKASGGRYIVTVPGRGYQLGVLPVAVDGAPAIAKAEPLPVTDEAFAAGPVFPLAAVRGGLRPALRVLLVAFAALGFLLLAWLGGRRLRPAPFSHTLVKRLTNSGDVKMVAISRSGRYLASVSSTAASPAAGNAAGGESLSVTDLRSGNSRVVLSDDAAALSSSVFRDILFSPDEAYVYYRTNPKDRSSRISSVSRVPVLGGEPALVVKDVDGKIAFLDGGERLCFWRGTEDGRFSVVSVDAEDGKDERMLAKGLSPEPDSAACSPDGQRVAISSEVGGISVLDFKTGQQRHFYESPLGKEIYVDLSWKADGSALLVSTVNPFDLDQALALISYPGAIRTQITSDLNSYNSSGMTEDGRKVVALQRNKNAQFQSFDLPLLGLLPAVHPEVIQFPWADFLGWRTDDQIVGATVTGGLKLKDVASSQEHAVHTARGAQFLQPSGCGANGLVATGSRSPDKALTIWHMNADGSELKQLTHDAEDILPVCSTDGQGVFYADNGRMNEAAIYRVAAQGGTPLKIAEGTVWFALSHSGERLAWIERNKGQQSLVLADAATGKRLSEIPIPATIHPQRTLTFAPDDQHIFLIVGGATSDSVYSMPLHEAPPLKQIEFRAERLGAIMVSPGGKHLGVVTAKPTADAVLLEDRP